MACSEETARIVEMAARNNALWCDAVCRAHGGPGEFHETLWINRHGTPKFYPDAVTLAGAGATPGQMRVISGLTETSRERAWAVKDSFGCLDLAALGFTPLFEAEWICLSRDLSDADGARSDHRCVDVASEEALASWERAWRGDGEALESEAAVRTFRPLLVEDANIRFVSVQREDCIVGGGILNRGAGVIGLSNCFALDAAPEEVWRILVSRARRGFPGAPLVGYESGADLEIARRIGFETMGALRVWSTPD